MTLSRGLVTGVVVALTLWSAEASAAPTFTDCDPDDAPNAWENHDCADIFNGTVSNWCTSANGQLDCDFSAVTSDLEIQIWLVGQFGTSGHDFVIFGNWEDALSNTVPFCCTIDDPNEEITAGVRLAGTDFPDSLSFIYRDDPADFFARLKPHLSTTPLEGRMRGGPGGDALYGSDWNENQPGPLYTEKLWGETDNDTIYGYGGADYLHGDGGIDEIWGDANDDIIYGGDGGDFLYGEGGVDIIAGGDGEDYIEGGPGADILDGRDDLDEIYGGDGNDVVIGDNGSFGDDGDADILSGEIGNDIVCAQISVPNGDGGDFLHGGAGDDQLWYWSGLGLGDAPGAMDGGSHTTGDSCGDGFTTGVHQDCESTLTAIPVECEETPTLDCEDLECLY